jgi:hypothetical protein
MVWTAEISGEDKVDVQQIGQESPIGNILEVESL